jgi:hypothetical protein
LRSMLCLREQRLLPSLPVLDYFHFSMVFMNTTVFLESKQL